ncbi:MAG: hypothetical protein QXS20_03755 [Candidatus Thorarchaeota archaeon]
MSDKRAQDVTIQNAELRDAVNAFFKIVDRYSEDITTLTVRWGQIEISADFDVCEYEDYDEDDYEEDEDEEE